MKEKLFIFILITIPAICIGSTEVYRVEPYEDVNDTSAMVAQSFIATCDTIKYISFFCGEERPTGKYTFSLNGSSLDSVSSAGRSYEYVGINCGETVVPGKTYELTISHSEGVNYYYNPNNPYEHGKLGDDTQKDLAAVIIGTNYPRDYWGIEAHTTWLPDTLFSADSSDTIVDTTRLDTLVNAMKDCGVKLVKEAYAWYEFQLDNQDQEAQMSP